jgi:hypothetical protein
MPTEREVRIEFTHEWLGHNPGSQKVLWEHVANELIGRGVAKEVVIETTEEKVVESPPQNKMVSKPNKAKKVFNRVR